MYSLNEKIKNLEPYQPLQGEYHIRLDANESCFNFSDEMIENIKTIVEKIDYNRYPDPMAAKLCKTFAAYYNISADLVTAGNGSDELISILMNCFLMKGDSIVTVAPDFSMYQFYASLAELNCVSAPKNDDLTIDIQQIIETVKQNNAKAVLFSNPCNPTSKGLAEEDILCLLKSVDALVILDEAYMDFWEASLLNRVNDFDNLIILRTASKAAGAAALRLGFAIANQTITKAMRAVKSPYNVNSLSQEIGTLLYSSTEYLSGIKKKIVKLRENLYNGCKALEENNQERIKVLEGCTNFVFIHSLEAEELYQYFLSKGIAIRKMGAYIRITAGTENENKEVLKTFKNYLT